MKSTIFIPKTIKVGFQNRSDTYTGKLGYVIYYDEKGKLRKETSWEGWRDKNIEPLELDNVPMEGFVLNKKVGDYNSGWGNHRMAYTRVYHPNGGWEFEITIENLLYILEHCTSTKGKGLEGELILGWDGKNHVLLPVDSPDYKAINAYNDILQDDFKLSAKTIQVGATYLTKGNEEWTYIGKFNYYDHYWDDDAILPNGKSFKRPELQPKKHYFFVKKEANGEYRLCTDKGNWKKFIAIIDENTHEEYAEMYDFMEGHACYSPIDVSATTYTPYTYEEFEKLWIDSFTIRYSSEGERWYEYGSLEVNVNVNGRIFIEKFRHRGLDQKPFISINHSIPQTYHPYTWNPSYKETKYTHHEFIVPFDNIKHVFDTYNPVYQTMYLQNGREY